MELECSLPHSQVPATYKWAPVTTSWRVLRLRMEERPPILRVAANILNKQSRTAGKGWSSSLGVESSANNSSLLKRILLRNIHRQKPRTPTDSLAPTLLLLLLLLLIINFRQVIYNYITEPNNLSTIHSIVAILYLCHTSCYFHVACFVILH